MKVLKRCPKCKSLYTNYCVKCEADHLKYAIEYGIGLCKHFNIKSEFFINFLLNNYQKFEEFKDYGSLLTYGSYLNIIGSIFYIYVNMKKLSMIRASNISTYVRKQGINNRLFHKYVGISFEILKNSGYGHFRPHNLNRTKVVHTCIKSLLGKLRKPVLYKHVISLMDTIKYDNPRRDPYIVAALYIAFYYRFMRGWDFPRKEYIERTGMSADTLANIYYGEFRYIAIQSFNGNCDRVLEENLFI